MEGHIIRQCLQLLGFMLLAALCVAASGAFAQNLDDELERIEALLPAHLRTPLPVKDSHTHQKEKPATPQTTSALEAFYQKAAGSDKLSQYGYAFLANMPQGAQVPVGAAQDSYILGAGDQLGVRFLGERKDSKSYIIDRSGALSLSLLPPVAAAGKSLAQLRADIEGLLKTQAYQGQVYISLERMRQISVLVAGHVAKPGQQRLSALQTPIEALAQAGGITKQGSLRQIRVVRAGKSHIIDLYPLLAGTGGQSDFGPLREGDRIIVPPVGPTLALSGDIRRAGIYEMLPQGEISIKEALALSGGPLAAGQNRIMAFSPQADGRRNARLIERDDDQPLKDGTLIVVRRTDDRTSGSFNLVGEVRSDGAYPINIYSKLSQLLRSPQAFGPHIYPLMGVISRREAGALTRRLIAFSPQDVFVGKADIGLRDGDIVRVFSQGDIRAIMADKAPTDANIEPIICSFVREHSVDVQGAARLPGLWPVAGKVAIDELVKVAGGALRDADMSRVEINRNASGLLDEHARDVSHRDIVDMQEAGSEGVMVSFGDAVRLPERFEAVMRQDVRIAGEVRHPGTYDLMRGDTLSMLIERAGGLTDQAYPAGAVFSRASERQREQANFAAAARELERSIAMASKDAEGRVNTGQIALAKDLAHELKNVKPVGRITVQADPAVLQREPAQDILLQADDHIFIPRRPLNVRVSGEVLNPATLQFRADKDVADYIAEAGGTTRNADKGRIFVLGPDGAARPLSGRSWSRVNPLMIIPGSTIVVPRDPKPFDFVESAKDITQILSNLAVTGIYAEDLVD